MPEHVTLPLWKYSVRRCGIRMHEFLRCVGPFACRWNSRARRRAAVGRPGRRLWIGERFGGLVPRWVGRRPRSACLWFSAAVLVSEDVSMVPSAAAFGLPVVVMESETQASGRPWQPPCEGGPAPPADLQPRPVPLRLPRVVLRFLERIGQSDERRVQVLVNTSRRSGARPGGGSEGRLRLRCRSPRMFFNLA